MKVLTKKWAEKYEQLRFINLLKEYDSKNTSYEEIETKSKLDYCFEISKDEELAKITQDLNILNNLYQSQIERDRKTLLSMPKEIYDKIKEEKTLILRYAIKKDKELLTSYAKKLLFEVEQQAEKANRITKIAEEYLDNEFIVDNFVGELVYSEYAIGKDYFINVGDFKICIENFEIIERDDYKINEWEEDNPLTLWTALHSAELHYISKNHYELHLLLVDGDKYANVKYWYFTLKGTNVLAL